MITSFMLFDEKRGAMVSQQNYSQEIYHHTCCYQVMYKRLHSRHLDTKIPHSYPTTIQKYTFIRIIMYHGCSTLFL
mgnify:CR=1 FL=1